jgi:hypothetical protein
VRGAVSNGRPYRDRSTNLLSVLTASVAPSTMMDPVVGETYKECIRMSISPLVSRDRRASTISESVNNYIATEDTLLSARDEIAYPSFYNQDGTLRDLKSIVRNLTRPGNDPRAIILEDILTLETNLTDETIARFSGAPAIDLADRERADKCKSELALLYHIMGIQGEAVARVVVDNLERDIEQWAAGKDPEIYAKNLTAWRDRRKQR